MENTELTNNGFYYFDYKGAIFYNMLAIMKNICTFAVLQVDELNHLAGKRSICSIVYWAFFMSKF